MIAFETVVVWTALFREIWVAFRTFTRKGPSILTLLLGITFAVMGQQARVAAPHPTLRWPGFVLLILALTVFEWAAFCVRGRTFSYIGNKDTPEFIFTGGPFQKIRHPFYTSYLLTHTAIALIFPTRFTIATAIATYVLLNYAAQFEEDKFANSPLADSYRAYVTQTGRFFPKLG